MPNQYFTVQPSPVLVRFFIEFRIAVWFLNGLTILSCPQWVKLDSNDKTCGQFMCNLHNEVRYSIAEEKQPLRSVVIMNRNIQILIEGDWTEYISPIGNSNFVYKRRKYKHNRNILLLQYGLLVMSVYVAWIVAHSVPTVISIRWRNSLYWFQVRILQEASRKSQVLNMQIPGTHGHISLQHRGCTMISVFGLFWIVNNTYPLLARWEANLRLGIAKQSSLVLGDPNGQ